MSYSPIDTITDQVAAVVPNILNLSVTFIAQKFSGGSATAGTLVENVTSANAGTLFGLGSQAQQVVKAFKAVNDQNKVNVFVLADPASGNAKASGTQTLTGSASESGKYKLTFNGRSYEASFAASATAESVLNDIRTAIAADTEAMITAGGTTTLILTHKHDGLIGNDTTTVSVQISNTAGTLTNCGFTPTAVAFTSGTGLSASMTTFAAATANIQTIYVCDYNIVKDSTLGVALINTLKARVDVDNQLTYSGLCFYVTDNDTDFETLVSGNALYKQSFLYPIRTKRVSTQYAKGDYHNNATFTIAAGFIATATAFINDKARLSKIKSGSIFGNKLNVGSNLSGLMIPSLNYSTSASSDFIKEDHEIWAALGVTTIITNGSSLEIGNEGYTTSINAVEKYMSASFLQYAIQQEMHTFVKSEQFRNKKQMPTVMLSIKAGINGIIDKLSQEDGDYQWLDSRAKQAMKNSISISVNSSDSSKYLCSYELQMLLPYTGIDMLMTRTLEI